jgi:hypothetical protein
MICPYLPLSHLRWLALAIHLALFLKKTNQAGELPTILKRTNPDWVNTTEQQRLPKESSIHNNNSSSTNNSSSSNNNNNNNKETTNNKGKKLEPVGLGHQHAPKSKLKDKNNSRLSEWGINMKQTKPKLKEVAHRTASKPLS